MHISKVLFTFVIIFTLTISATAGYLANVLNVNQERAELNAEIAELEEEVEQLELQLQAERANQEAENTEEATE